MKIAKLFREVKSEAKKVTWTSASQTRVLTVAVILISTFIAIYILVIDNLLQKIVDFIIKF